MNSVQIEQKCYEMPVWQKYSICLSTWDFGLLAAWRAFLGYIPDTSA
jgi:hypothetical protein